MKVVAFDESGHSGENLLDPQQPVFALAGICLEETQARDLVASALETRQSSELKFSALRKRAAGQEVVLDLLNSPLLGRETRRLCVSEKSWFLAGKIIDLLLEPLTVSNWLFYDSGMHRKMADWLHAKAAGEIGPELWATFKHAFVHAARSQGDEEQEAMDELCQRLGEVKVSAEGTASGKIFSAIPVSADYLAEQLGGRGAKDALEPALTSLVEQLQGWSERLGEPFRVIHDDSKVIQYWAQELREMSSPAIEPVSIEIDQATFAFPFLATSIEFATSDTTPLVQLADIVAGAATWWLRDEMGAGSDLLAPRIGAAGLRAEWATGSLKFQETALLGGQNLES